jgi:tetratricopeptide (TPR) repeat protein
MKNKFKILIAMSALLFVAGCDSFLDRDPYDSVSSNTVYVSATLAENAVVGVYSNLLSNYISTSALNWDALSSVLDPSDASISLSYPYLRGTVQSNHSMFSDHWRRFYEGINRANDVIANIGRTVELPAETRACRIAECKFIRAYYYFKLNTLWKGVPVYLENLAPGEYTRSRSTENQVWQVIIDDLDDVIECESMPGKYTAGDSNYGRITKGAAYALRGKVYMWLKEWDKAEADFRKVGECGFDLFNGSYADLFKEANEKSDEMVFSITMEEVEGHGNVFSRTYGNWMTAGNGNSDFYMNVDFVNTYQWADGSPFSFDDVIPGYESMSPEARSVYFCRNNMTDSEKGAMVGYGADMTVYDPAANESRILGAYTGRDPRLTATVIVPYTDYLGGMAAGSAIDYQTRWPFRSENSPSFDLRTRSTGNMLYCIRKFVAVGKEYANPLFNPVDVPVIRYADVLLCLAECLNEQGRTDEAVPFVNRVRKRAGVAELNSGPQVTVTGQSDLRKRIMDEKHWELACEEQLYLEEMRWNTWKETKFAASNGLQQCWGSPVYNYIWGGDAYHLWAIPAAECEKNTNLIQNEDWY